MGQGTNVSRPDRIRLVHQIGPSSTRRPHPVDHQPCRMVIGWKTRGKPPQMGGTRTLGLGLLLLTDPGPFSSPSRTWTCSMLSQTLHGTAIYAAPLTPLAPPQWVGKSTSPISRVWVDWNHSNLLSVSNSRCDTWISRFRVFAWDFSCHLEAKMIHGAGFASFRNNSGWLADRGEEGWSQG